MRVVAAPENDGTQEKWELERNEMRRRWRWWECLWESGKEDGGKKREEICGRYACSFGLLGNCIEEAG
jgi:hypothetical protein